MGVGTDPLVSASVSAAFVFEPMVAADLPEVMELERLAFPKPWTPGLFLHELKLSFSRVYLARSGNGSRRLLGYVCRWVVGDEVHILNLAVHPDDRRPAPGAHWCSSVLDTRQRSRRAERQPGSWAQQPGGGCTLPRHGLYRDRPAAELHYGDGEDAVIMERRLGPNPDASSNA